MHYGLAFAPSRVSFARQLLDGLKQKLRGNFQGVIQLEAFRCLVGILSGRPHVGNRLGAKNKDDITECPHCNGTGVYVETVMHAI